jgi:hypothetical protein
MKMIYPNIYVDSIHDIALEEGDFGASGNMSTLLLML